jgi:S-adenosylmethionine/arginine decarboxylase-like enzyme
MFVACKPSTYSSTCVKFAIKYVTGKNYHIAKSKFVKKYVRTVKSTKYFTIDFPTKAKCVVRICENHFCIHTFRIHVKYVLHTNSSNCNFVRAETIL